MATAWPYLFAFTLANGVFNVVGHVVAAYLFAPVNGALFLYSFLLSLPLLLASIVAGIAYDLDSALPDRKQTAKYSLK